MTKLQNCIHMCTTIGNIPSSYVDSMSYEEQILWLCKFLNEKVLPTLNYMVDFFDNLDVQSEVNKKLEQMSESGELEEIISAYLETKALIVFDTVDELKNSTILKDGSTVRTLGYYTKNDLGSCIYKIRNLTNQDVIDNATIISLNNSDTLIAEMIKTGVVNSKQIGCKTDGTDNSAIINNYLANNNDTGLHFVDGDYSVSSEIDTIGNVTMSDKAYLVATTSMDCVVHINKNLVIPAGSFSNNYPTNQELKINVNCNKLAKTGIRTDKLHWAKLTLTVKDPVIYGVHTRYRTNLGHAENTFNIQVTYDSNDGTNTATGCYIGGSDDIYTNIVAINTRYGVEIHGNDNSINTIHCWLVNSGLWNGSVFMKIAGTKNHISDLIVDTYETGITVTDDFNKASGVFAYYIDFMFGAINTTFIPQELRSSYKIWDFTGIGDGCKRNSTLVIENYTGNDSDTAKIVLGGNGICPFNTVLGYNNDYTTPDWNYSLDYLPQGNFYFKGNSDVSGKPSTFAGGQFHLSCYNAPYGKVQELVPVSVSTNSGNTTYNTSTGLPTGNYNYFWKRTFNKYGTGTNSWAQYASFYVSTPTQ